MVDVGTQEEPLDFELARQSATRQHFFLTRPARSGRAAPTKATKARVMTMGGLVAASLKTWWISGSLPYLSTSTVGTGTSGLRSIDRGKIEESYAWELPEEPMTTRASMGSGRERNWIGRSFWV
jgi:hypothetical protein